MEGKSFIDEKEFEQIMQLYDECEDYLKNFKDHNKMYINFKETDFGGSDEVDNKIKPINKTDSSEEKHENQMKDKSFENNKYTKLNNNEVSKTKNNKTKETNRIANKKSIRNEISVNEIGFKVQNEKPVNEIGFIVENEILKEMKSEHRSNRLRRLSQQLPKIIITQSNSSLNIKDDKKVLLKSEKLAKSEGNISRTVKKDRDPFGHGRKASNGMTSLIHRRPGYGDFPKRLVSKGGLENVALISNVPFEKIRLLNDTFHTLINLRWRWIVMGTVVVHFLIWLVFAVFWYITALAHYDFSPNPPARSCVTGGKDFLTIFLASVEAQTTIGFGDRAIDEECPESIFLFIMQLILGTGLSGVLTCVVYAKLTRPEKLSRDGVGFSKKAAISMRDGHLCLMMRAWDLNYDHIIGSEFSAHFVNTHRTKEGEIIRYYAHSLPLHHRQFLLWPVTLVHVIDEDSPLWRFTPEMLAITHFEITVSLKGASASMGTFTQSQTSYTPKEIVWGHRFPPVVKYDSRKQKYVIDHKKLDVLEPVETPICSASELYSSTKPPVSVARQETVPGNFSEKISSFVLERTSSFRYSKGSPKLPSTPIPTPTSTRPQTPSNFSEQVTELIAERPSSLRSVMREEKNLRADVGNIAGSLFPSNDYKFSKNCRQRSCYV